MRTIIEETTLYTYDELSEAAQEKAYSRWLECFDYPFDSDLRAVLEWGADYLPCKVTDWRVGADRFNVTTRVASSWGCDADLEEIEGYRAWVWLRNNLEHLCYEYRWHPKRRSRFFVERSCPTGICFGMDLLDPIVEYIAGDPKRVPSVADVLQECYDSLFRSVQRDMEYQESPEAFREACEANEYEFTEHGGWA